MAMQPQMIIPFYIPGAMSADLTISFEAWCDMTLHKVFALQSNDGSATLAVGITGTAEAYITAFAMGDSNVPARKEAITDFDGTVALSQYPHISDGTVVLLTIDHDGSSGTSGSNVTIVLVCSPG